MTVPAWIYDNSPIDDPLGHGERAVEWLKRLKHPKSKAKGKAFQLDPWQARIIKALYGPRNPDGSRVVRRLMLLLPRGNRKTSLCAAITLLHLIGPEREPGSLIVSAASAHEQARELFLEAAMIVEGDQRLGKHLKVRDYTSAIGFQKERSRYIAVASDGKVQHGKTPNVVIADELHAWEGSAGRKQWEALDSALVKVPGTLMVIATTAGRGQENLAWKEFDYALRCQKGEVNDPSTLPVIFAAEPEDDWKDEELWHAINPGMKHGYPDLASYRDKAKKAMNSPSDRDSFMQYNLDIWRDHSASPFVDMLTYDRCRADFTLDQVRDFPCWLGVDLSSNIDLTCIVACWKGDDDSYYLKAWFFVPRENLVRRSEVDGVPYVEWSRQGFIEATPGNVIDHRRVEQKVREICAEFDVQEICFDPHMGAVMMSNLSDDGLPAVAHRQGWVSMSPAISALETAIIGGTLKHDGCPVLRWNFGNIAVERDKANNMSFHKGRSRDRIDGAVASAMAVGRATAGESGRSIYTDINARPEGLLVF